MRLLYTIAIAALTLVTLSGSAEARRTLIEEYEALSYVAPTTIKAARFERDAKMALCHLQKRSRLFFVVYDIQSIGYALSNDKYCRESSYTPLSEAQFLALQEDGSIDKSLPVRPQLTRAEQTLPYVWLGFFVLVALVTAAVALRDRFDKLKSRPSPHFLASMTNVMCHAATLSGFAPHVAANSIVNHLQSTTRTAMSRDKIAAHLASADARMTREEINAIGNGLTAHQKEQVMRAAMLFLGPAIASGDTAAQFIADLGRGLGLTQAQYQVIIAETKALVQAR